MTKAKLPERRRQWSLLPEFSELFTGFPGWSDLRPTLENRSCGWKTRWKTVTT